MDRINRIYRIKKYRAPILFSFENPVNPVYSLLSPNIKSITFVPVGPV